jgi:hypothetical protein
MNPSLIKNLLSLAKEIAQIHDGWNETNDKFKKRQKKRAHLLAQSQSELKAKFAAQGLSLTSPHLQNQLTYLKNTKKDADNLDLLEAFKARRRALMMTPLRLLKQSF